MSDAIVAACMGGYSAFNNSRRMINLVTLLTISNIESANNIFFTICFKTGTSTCDMKYIGGHKVHPKATNMKTYF